jgi:hypothetical protein
MNNQNFSMIEYFIRRTNEFLPKYGFKGTTQEDFNA